MKLFAAFTMIFGFLKATNSLIDRFKDSDIELTEEPHDECADQETCFGEAKKRVIGYLPFVIQGLIQFSTIISDVILMI